MPTYRRWNKRSVLARLRALHRSGADLSYSAMTRRQQSLLSAAAYHFGSYRAAVEHAGVDYAEIQRRPRWTKPKIIRLIKQARRQNRDLHWTAVTSGRNELARAAFAAIQPRLFGSWNRALHAAGLDADEVICYRRWCRASLVCDLKQMHADGEALNSGALQREDPGMHAAAIRHFGSYDAALRAARINPMRHRQRRRWTREKVLGELRRFVRRNGGLTDRELRRESAALYGATLRVFRTLAAARKALKSRS